ncbi:DNA polymerase [Embleya sp. NPDC050154]|uniref:DNA polymerase n=1 Tax=Embleya sp. NPDC050154 TaxID=3363988 RepID=UPI0037A4007A
MSVHTHPCGMQDVRIHAPGRDEAFDVQAWFAFTRSDPVLGLDVETRAIVNGGPGHFGPDSAVRLVQFGTPTAAWVLDPAVPEQHAAIRTVLTDPARRFVTHTTYDTLAIRAHLGIDLGYRVADTHLLSKLVNPDERAGHGLKELTLRHLDDGLVTAREALYERMRSLAPTGHRAGDAALTWGWNNIPTDDPAYVVYAGLDAVYVRRLFPLLLARCAPFSHLVPVEHWLSAQSVGITARGLLLDVDYTRNLLDQVRTEHTTAAGLIEAELGFPGGSPKFAAWVADNVGTELPRTATGRPQVTRDVLDHLAEEVDAGRLAVSEEATRMLAARRTMAATSNTLSNLKGFLAAADPGGRVHPQINTLRARTGRMSVTAPALQTLKKHDPRLRHCFRADPGHTLVACDFAQVEIRVAAALSRDATLTRVIASGVDIHDATAELMYGPDFTKEQRTISKRATFGTVYGGGARALAAQTGVPVATAKGVIDRWRRAYPDVVRYGRAIAELPVVVTGSGRRIPADPERPYANGNYAIQSTARDLLVAAVHDLIVSRGMPGEWLWLFVHDEVIVHVPTDQAEHVRDLLTDAMTGTYRGVPIAADAEILGTHWGRLADPETVHAPA